MSMTDFLIFALIAVLLIMGFFAPAIENTGTAPAATTPPAASVAPVATAAVAAASSGAVGAAAVEQTSSDNPYTVVPGDTLSSIARRFGTSVAALVQANPDLTDPDLIYPGQQLTIP